MTEEPSHAKSLLASPNDFEVQKIQQPTFALGSLGQHNLCQNDKAFLDLGASSISCLCGFQTSLLRELPVAE
jgi:hypothetical protein